MEPTKTLPDGYCPQARLDLSESRMVCIFLATSLLLFFPMAGYFFTQMTEWLRQDGMTVAMNLPVGLAMIAGVVIIVLLHEAVHGLFFWHFTGERPVIGMKGIYTYASAPDWFLPRNQLVVVAIAPLVVLSLAGLLLIPLVPAWLLAPLVLAVTVNAAAAVGDVLLLLWLLAQPASSLVKDAGDTFTVCRHA